MPSRGLTCAKRKYARRVQDKPKALVFVFHAEPQPDLGETKVCKVSGKPNLFELFHNSGCARQNKQVSFVLAGTLFSIRSLT